MIKNIFAIIGGMCMIVVIVFLIDYNQSSVVVYDCGMAEWHPDIPVQVKEECRKLKYEDLKRQQNESKFSV